MTETTIVRIASARGGGFCPACGDVIYRGDRVAISNTGRQRHSRCNTLPLGPEARQDPYERRPR